MSRGTFYSHNKVGETTSFQTNATSFDPLVTFLSGSDRVSWDLGNGSGYTAGNSISHTYPDSSTKTVTLRTNLLSNLNVLQFPTDSIIGNLDLSGWDNLGGGFTVHTNPDLTGITHTYSSQPFVTYYAQFCGLIGNLDLSMFPNFGGYFKVFDNPLLTSITHTASTQVFSEYDADECNLTGNLDLSMLTALGGVFDVGENGNLTSITHGPSSTPITSYIAYLCDLTGNHDMSPLSKLGGVINLRVNPNLTAVTHSPSPQTISWYQIDTCDLTGNHDMTWCPNLSGFFGLYDNDNLTSVTHTASTQAFSTYRLDGCDLTGNLDLSMLTGLGGDFRIFSQASLSLTGVTHTASTQVFTAYNAAACGLTGNLNLPLNLSQYFYINSNINLNSITHIPSVTGEILIRYYAYTCNLTGNHDVSMLKLGDKFNVSINSSLTGITHTASTETFTSYRATECDLTNTHDLSMLTGLGGEVALYENSNLTNIIFPYSTQSFANTAAASTNRAFGLHNCNLDFINFLPLSGATLDVNAVNGASIGLEDNGMSASIVNQTLFDFYVLNNTYSLPGWSGVTLNIGGTNAAPDAVSGGVDGAQAKTRLVNDYGWTITSN